MATLLHQRGRLVLHASAVEVSGGVVAFLGRSGQGKSTIAAALHREGYAMVTDDVVALDQEGGSRTLMVTPGFPRIKLWPDSLSALGNEPENFPRVHPSEEKRSLAASKAFTSTNRPLRQIYVLADGANPSVAHLKPQEALVELIRHTSRIELFPFSKAPAHLRQCVDLVNSISICRLTVPRSFKALPDVVRLIETDLSVRE